MPTSLVKTPRDERLWQKAKDRAEEEGHAENWAYIMGIYKRMNPDRFDKSAAFSTSRAMYLREEIARALQRPLPAARKTHEVGAVVHELLAFLGGQEFADTMSDKVTQGIIRSAPRTAAAEGLGPASAFAEPAQGMVSRVAARHLRAYYDPGQRSDTGYLPGNVRQEAPYRGVGSQMPEPRDRDGKIIKVPEYGMMEIPGYEWHDKSKEFHSGT
jgi:hypothetical protein